MLTLSAVVLLKIFLNHFAPQTSTSYATPQMPINVFRLMQRWSGPYVFIKVIVRPRHGQNRMEEIVSQALNLILLKLKTGLRNHQHHEFCLQL